MPPVAEQNYYNPQEIAYMLRISKQTLIRYEAKGVFPPPRRNPLNGWREYTAEDVQKLRKIIGR
jgi:DNA-binding transcriptional MerR regulator